MIIITSTERGQNVVTTVSLALLMKRDNHRIQNPFSFYLEPSLKIFTMLKIAVTMEIHKKVNSGTVVSVTSRLIYHVKTKLKCPAEGGPGPTVDVRSSLFLQTSSSQPQLWRPSRGLTSTQISHPGDSMAPPTGGVPPPGDLSG